MPWPTAELQSELQALLPGLQVQVLAEVDSTNTRLLERARTDPTPVLLVAETQTAGRGRLGRAWQAQPGASLTFSLGLPLAPRAWEGLSLAVGLALADALDPPGRRPPGVPPAIGLKWPNDLWLWDGPGQGRKLGGVLIETAGGSARRHAVIGVGVNIAAIAAPQGLATGCLHEIEPAATPAATLALVAGPLLQALLRFQSEGFAPLAEAYAVRDLLRGQAVHATGQPPLAGVADGVDVDGALRLRGAAGERIVSGEVSVRFASNPLPATSSC
jgi:BirA family transcriptional regulator, biotin operon repressor / biotin---[acetyl-CoA-carboxylase] ligase